MRFLVFGRLELICPPTSTKSPPGRSKADEQKIGHVAYAAVVKFSEVLENDDLRIALETAPISLSSVPDLPFAPIITNHVGGEEVG